MDGETLDSRPARWLILVAAGYLAVDFLILADPPDVSRWIELPLRWNWPGKMLSIAFSCLLLVSSPWLRQNVGLGWRQSPGSLKLSIAWFAVYLAIGTFFGLIGPRQPPSIETPLYQAIMPGIDEELSMHGIALALLERAFGRSPLSCRMRFGLASGITSLVFGIGHAAYFVGQPWLVAILSFVLITSSSAALALVRTRSGSLLWPILCHGAWDGSWALTAMLP
jgi:membrane protease YdiL (CAAX protease family)